MINKSAGFYSVTCDICGEESPEMFDEFHEAVKYKKDMNWKSKINDYGDWVDVCPSCQWEE